MSDGTSARSRGGRRLLARAAVLGGLGLGLWLLGTSTASADEARDPLPVRPVLSQLADSARSVPRVLEAAVPEAAAPAPAEAGPRRAGGAGAGGPRPPPPAGPAPARPAAPRAGPRVPGALGGAAEPVAAPDTAAVPRVVGSVPAVVERATAAVRSSLEAVVPA